MFAQLSYINTYNFIESIVSIRNQNILYLAQYELY